MARQVFRWFVSARTTVVLLCALAFLLLLNVLLPQSAVLGEAGIEALAEADPVSRFLLVDLGLRSLPTSPVFVAVLTLFFLNLAMVLLARIGPTWRRIALRPKAEEGLKAWARLEETFKATLPERWSPRLGVETLRGHGFQVRRPGEKTLWGVKHRTAPLGFLLFHLSFFLISAGGVMLYYTRSVGTVVLTEGQEFEGRFGEILRSPPMGRSPDLRFRVERVEARMERGEPVGLTAALRFQTPGASAARTSRVNHPAHWGPTTILVQQAGLAPVIWLQDERGFTLDRVVAPTRTRSEEPTIVPLQEGRWNLVVSPLAPDAEFPSREDLPSTAITFEVLGQDESLFAGSLRPGEAAVFPGGRLVLEELRYWVGMRVISERGGGLLIAGFTLGVLGLVWRLLWYRREVAVTWDDEEFRLVGRSEYFSDRFQRELRSMFAMMKTGESAPESRRRHPASMGEG